MHAGLKTKEPECCQKSFFFFPSSNHSWISSVCNLIVITLSHTNAVMALWLLLLMHKVDFHISQAGSEARLDLWPSTLWSLTDFFGHCAQAQKTPSRPSLASPAVPLRGYKSLMFTGCYFNILKSLFLCQSEGQRPNVKLPMNLFYTNNSKETDFKFPPFFSSNSEAGSVCRSQGRWEAARWGTCHENLTVNVPSSIY